MTIEKGREWARPFSDDLEPVDVIDDADFAAHAFGAREATPTAPPVLTPRQGSLLATVGLDQPRTDQAMVYDLDLVLVRLDDDRLIPMIASVIVPPGIRGDAVAVMNVPWWRTYRLAPRAHPNDGLVDIIVGRVPPGQWPEARRRARSGTHLPHPGISATRSPSWRREFGRKRSIWVDGRRVGRSRTIEVSVLPDAVIMVA